MGHIHTELGELMKKPNWLKKRCPVKYDTARNTVVRCDMRIGHGGNHVHISWLAWFGGSSAEWSDDCGHIINPTKGEK